MIQASKSVSFLPSTSRQPFFSSVQIDMVRNLQDAYENIPQDEFIYCFKKESIKVSRGIEALMYLSYVFAMYKVWKRFIIST